MSKNRNVRIIQRLQEIFGFTQGDMLPDDVTGLVAVVPVLPTCNIVRHGQSATVGTIYTTPADKDFYLITATLDWDMGVLNTNVSSGLEVRVDNNVARYVIQLSATALTIGHRNLAINIPYPGLKLDRGTAIRLVQGIGGGDQLQSATIIGYTSELKQ